MFALYSEFCSKTVGCKYWTLFPTDPLYENECYALSSKVKSKNKDAASGDVGCPVPRFNGGCPYCPDFTYCHGNLIIESKNISR